MHKALERAQLPHAFGGALAGLVHATARGTIDIDVNYSSARARQAVSSLPAGVAHPRRTSYRRREGQVLWWEQTPIDLFLNTTRFHDEAAQRTRWETFSNRSIPFLSCEDIAVFKAFFNRTKDWADLEEMHAAGTLDLSAVVGILVEYLGAADERIERLKTIARS